MSFSFLDRFSELGLLSNPLERKSVNTLGVSEDGLITQDNWCRGDITALDVSNSLDQWFNELRKRKNQYVYFPTLNNQIHIYGPIEFSRTNALLEYVAFTGVVDLHTDLDKLSPAVEKPAGWVMSRGSFYSVRDSLNGEHDNTTCNILIDFKHKVIIARDFKDLSPYDLALFPMMVLESRYDLCFSERHQSGSSFTDPHVDLAKARKIAHDYVKKVFF